MSDEVLGPGFDTGTLLYPTRRKLVCCWMELAGLKTLVLPRVFDQLTEGAGSSSQFRSSDAWVHVAKLPDTPYHFPTWTPELDDAAYELRRCFTEACFPNRSAHQILFDSDAVIVSQALALGTDLLVTSDVGTIDHYEVNLVVEKRLGRNAGFVTTLDDALQRAHCGADAGHSLLILGLMTVAPDPAGHWTVEQAHEDLARLREAAVGASLPAMAQRLETRWTQTVDLDETLAEAQTLASQSHVLKMERVRRDWIRIRKRTLSMTDCAR